MVAEIDIIENYLTISHPESDDIRLDDCRRITGPSLLWGKAWCIIRCAACRHYRQANCHRHMGNRGAKGTGRPWLA